MQLGYQLKTAISNCIPPKLPANCSCVQQLQQQLKKKHDVPNNSSYRFAAIKKF